MTVISDGESVLETCIGKNSEDVAEELLKIPNLESVTKVCIDMSSSFAKGIRKVIPWAETVLDRFHIIKLLNKYLWDVNKDGYRKLDEKVRKKFSNIRYLLSKEYNSLPKDDKRLIKDYLRLNSEVGELYWHIQEFRKILFYYQGASHSYVSNKLNEWTRNICKHLKKFVKTIETWWEEVINACIFSESNGVQEGLNNKIKLVKRRAFGYRNSDNFKYRIMGEVNC